MTNLKKGFEVLGLTDKSKRAKSKLAWCYNCKPCKPCKKCKKKKDKHDDFQNTTPAHNFPPFIEK